MTELQRAVQKEVRRIQRFVRRAEARGYEFDRSITNIKFNKRRATRKELERLKKYTPEKMYDKSQYASELTGGEIVSGRRGRELERSEAARKGAERRQQKRRNAPTVDIIDIVESRLRELPDVVHIKGKRISVQEWKSPCLDIFYRELRERGAYWYADYLLSIQESLFECLDGIEYSDSDLETVKAYFTKIATLLKGSVLEFEEMQDIENSYDEFMEF